MDYLPEGVNVGFLWQAHILAYSLRLCVSYSLKL